MSDPTQTTDRRNICGYPTCSERGAGHPLACNCRLVDQPRTQTTANPGDVVRAIAAMHDRAAARSHWQARTVHEQCATHLRAISDDPEAIRQLVEQSDRTELCSYDL